MRVRDGNASSASVASGMGFLIPSIVHLTFKSTNVPQTILHNVQRNMKRCSMCEFRFYTDDDVDVFLRANFDDAVYGAFRSINGTYGAMKADFFRYCVLYKVGGIYADIKSSINCRLFSLIEKSDRCILDVPRATWEPWRRLPGLQTFEQWVLIFAAGHPYLGNMIRQMCQTIQSRSVPRKIPMRVRPTAKDKVLFMTGPDAFSRAVKDVIAKAKRGSALQHRCVNYDGKFSHVGRGCTNYKAMYKINEAVHYSECTAPFFIKTSVPETRECEHRSASLPERETTCAHSPLSSTGGMALVRAGSPGT